MIGNSAGMMTLLLQAAAAVDTVIVRQVPAERGWFEQVTGIASGLMTLALLALAVFLIPAAWSFRKSYKKATALLDRISADINPIMRHASAIADNVDYVTTAIRTDVQRINATVAAANQRINQAIDLTEQRLHDFNALLSVAQNEAEDLFVSTAATIRGVRTGASSLESGGPEIASRRPRTAETGGSFDPLDDAGELDDLEDLDDGDSDDLDDDAGRRSNLDAGERDAEAERRDDRRGGTDAPTARVRGPRTRNR